MAKETRENILNTAEYLFAERGFVGVSIRAITAEAKVNLGAVHYHFGSKEALVKEVFARRIGAVNGERLKLLEDYTRQLAGAGPDLEELVRIFVGPPLRLLQSEGGEIFMRVFGRISAEASQQLRSMVVDLFKEVFMKFSVAFEQAAPEIPKQELMWRFHFVIGAMAHTMLHGELFNRFSPMIAELSDVEENIERLTKFGTAGLLAPLTEEIHGRIFK